MDQVVGEKPTGRYNVFAEVACGGMAMVYLGQLEGEHGFKRSVAIKRMHAQYTRDQEFRDMFLDEARLVAKIRHPNVVPTLDIVSREDALLLVMEFVEGESVSTILAGTKAPIPPRIAVAIAHDTLCGLHAAHELTGDDGGPLKVIHRDVSPANILVGKDGLSRILDFGVAKAVGRSMTTKDGSIKGKVPYMPPEQLWGSELDRTVDTYATAVCLWEMLTGRRLFKGENEADTMRRVVEDEVVPPSSVNPRVAMLDDVVMRGLSRDPSKRFQTALDFARALERALPPASRLETGEWVADVAAPTLARRGELLRQMLRGEAPPAPFDVASLATVLTTATSRTAVVHAMSQRQTTSSPWRQGVAIAAGIVAVMATIGTTVAIRRATTATAAAAPVANALTAQPPPASALAPAPEPVADPAPSPSAKRPSAKTSTPPSAKAIAGKAPAPGKAAAPAKAAAEGAPAPHSDAALGSRY